MQTWSFMLLMNFSNKLKLCAPKPARTQSPKTLTRNPGLENAYVLPLVELPAFSLGNACQRLRLTKFYTRATVVLHLPEGLRVTRRLTKFGSEKNAPDIENKFSISRILFRNFVKRNRWWQAIQTHPNRH